MEDVFTYAARRVKNKSALARIGHSAKLHSVRSAVSSKGSAFSKFTGLLGMAARATLGAIPLPAVGSLIAAVETAVEKAIRSKIHDHRKKAAVTEADKVKFELKELSLEEMDRFRWKVQEAVSEFNKAAGDFMAVRNKKEGEHAKCDAFYEAALKIEQAVRRIDLLEKKCLGVFAAMKMTMDWNYECYYGPQGDDHKWKVEAPVVSPNSILGRKNELRKIVTDAYQAELDYLRPLSKEARVAFLQEYHLNCGDWCFYGVNTSAEVWSQAVDKAASVLNVLATPFVPESFSNNLGSLWKKD